MDFPVALVVIVGMEWMLTVSFLVWLLMIVDCLLLLLVLAVVIALSRC